MAPKLTLWSVENITRLCSLWTPASNTMTPKFVLDCDCLSELCYPDWSSGCNFNKWIMLSSGNDQTQSNGRERDKADFTVGSKEMFSILSKGCLLEFTCAFLNLAKHSKPVLFSSPCNRGVSKITSTLFSMQILPDFVFRTTALIVFLQHCFPAIQ